MLYRLRVSPDIVRVNVCKAIAVNLDDKHWLLARTIAAWFGRFFASGSMCIKRSSCYQVDVGDWIELD